MKARKVGTIAALLMSGALAMPVLAQADPNAGGNPPPAPGGNNGGGRNFDPSAFRQRMLARMKEQLGATDDEFAAISPKLEKVFQLQRDVGGMRGMRGRGQGGPGGPGGPGQTPSGKEPVSPVQKANSDLQATLDNKDAKPEEIKAKLEALRAAKAQAKEDLAAAQKDLQSILTQRQEAVLVMDGLLN